MTEYILSGELMSVILDTIKTAYENDVPEIVRCRDCRYYEQTLGNIDACNRETEESDWLMLVEPNGFCAWAEPATAGSGEPTPEIKACEAAWDNASDLRKPPCKGNYCPLCGAVERTCKSTTPDAAWCFACSECGKSFPRYELHLAHNHGEINYCPNCGARVVE